MNFGLDIIPTCYPLTMAKEVRQSNSVSKFNAAFHESFLAWNLPNKVHKNGDKAS
jgi:hypothetical protein